MVKVMGGWADGTLALRLDGGMAVLLKDRACSSAVDPSVVLALPGLEELDGVSPEERLVVIRQLREARTLPFPQFIAHRNAALLLGGTSEGAAKAWKTRKRIGGFAGIKPAATATGTGAVATGVASGVHPVMAPDAPAVAKPSVIKPDASNDDDDDEAKAAKTRMDALQSGEADDTMGTDTPQGKKFREVDDALTAAKKAKAEKAAAPATAHQEEPATAEPEHDEFKPFKADPSIAPKAEPMKPLTPTPSPTAAVHKVVVTKKPKRTPIAKVGHAIARLFAEDHIGDPNVQVFYSKIKHLRR